MMRRTRGIMIVMVAAGTLWTSMLCAEGGVRYSTQNRYETAKMLRQVEPFDDFENGHVDPYWHLDHGATAKLVDQHVTSGKHALEVTFPETRAHLRYRRTGLDGYGGNYSRSLEVLGARFLFYDDFRFDVFNPEAETLTLDVSFGVRTLTFPLKPGENTIVVPCEDIASGVDRMTRATHRIVLGVERAKPTTLTFDHFRLERETVGRQMAKLAKCFDFGPEDMLRGGFLPVTAKTGYDSSRGYGWLEPNLNDDDFKLRDIRSSGVMPLDDLLRDGVRNLNSPFVVDCPNGKYRVQIVGGWHWGGIYHLTPMDYDFTVKAEGEVKFLRLRASDPAERAKRFYGNDRTFYHFDEDTWSVFGAPVYGPILFDVEVTDGQLTLEFATSPQPDKGTLNFMIMYPVDDAGKLRTELGRFWYDLRRRYNRVSYPPLSPALARSMDKSDLHEEFLDPMRRIEKTSILLGRPEFSGHDLVVFSRNHLDQVYPDTVPDPEEETGVLRAFSPPGQTAAVTFSLFALRDIKDVRVEVGPLVGPEGNHVVVDPADVRMVRYSRRMLQAGYGGAWPYMVVPWYLVTFNAVDLDKYLSRRFWIDVNLPPDTPPGKYRGTVRIVSTAHDTAEINLKLEVEVPSFRLKPADPGRFVAIYQVQPGNPGNEPYGYGARTQNTRRLPREHARAVNRQFEQLHRQEIRAMLETLRGAGFDTLYAHDWLKDIDEADIQLMRPFKLIPLTRIERAAKNRPKTPDSTAEWVLVDAKGKRAWCTTLDSCDEDVIARLKKEGLKVYLGRPRGYASLVDDAALARWMSGVWLWRSGADGIVVGPVRNHWGDPYSPFDGNGGERGSLLMPSSREWPVPNPSRILLEIREGIEDYRYLVTLERLIRASADTEETRLAREFLDALRKEIPGKLSDVADGFYPSRITPGQGWSPDRYERFRRDAAHHIALLQALKP